MEEELTPIECIERCISVARDSASMINYHISNSEEPEKKIVDSVYRNYSHIEYAFSDNAIMQSGIDISDIIAAKETAKQYILEHFSLLDSRYKDDFENQNN